VGASNFYVQLPFLMEGLIAGLFGWLVATGLLIVVKSLWLDGLQQYFGFHIQLGTSDLVEVVLLSMIIGLALCVTPSFPTLRRYLRVRRRWLRNRARRSSPGTGEPGMITT